MIPVMYFGGTAAFKCVSLTIHFLLARQMLFIEQKKPLIKKRGSTAQTVGSPWVISELVQFI